MKGKLTISPYSEEFDYYRTEVFRGIYSYDYEIIIKTSLDDTFENIISNPYDFEKSIDVSIFAAKDNSEDIKFYEDIKKNVFDYVNNASDITFEYSPKEIGEFVKKNPILKTKRIIFEDYGNFSLDYVNELENAFFGDMSNIYFQIFGNNNLINFKDYKATVIAINKKISEIECYDFSPLEKIMYVYDMVRDRVYTEVSDDEDKNISRDLTSVLLGDKIVCVGYSKIFAILLKKFGIDCKQVVLRHIDNGSGHMRCVIYIKDDKYDVDGVYYFDPTWDSKKNKLDNEFLYSYKYFARTKNIMDSLDGEKLIDKAFPYYSDNLVLEFSEQVDKVGFEGLSKEMIKSINTMYSLINDKVLINMAYFDPIAYSMLRPSKEEIVKELESIVDYFDRPITADILLKVLYNVRKQQYYSNEQKYPFGVEEFSKIVNLSGWYYDGTLNENMELIFARTKAQREKIKNAQTIKCAEENNITRDIQCIKLSKVLKKVYNKKRK